MGVTTAQIKTENITSIKIKTKNITNIQKPPPAPVQSFPREENRLIWAVFERHISGVILFASAPGSSKLQWKDSVILLHVVELHYYYSANT